MFKFSFKLSFSIHTHTNKLIESICDKKKIVEEVEKGNHAHVVQRKLYKTNK